MPRFSNFLGGKEPDESLVRAYVATRGEWVALEFKSADRAPVFGLRKTVSAFGNKDGGDIFLGVTDSGSLDGTIIDLATVSRILEQEGAPPRERTLTNLVPLVREPRRVALANGKFVYWLDVAAQGLLVAAFDPADGLLHLYDRPGAESEELKGFAAIDLFQRKTRARLLVSLFSEFRRIVRAIPQSYVGPNQVREDTIRPILLILESPEWQAVATESDRNLTNRSYLGGLLSFPGDAEQWERLSYQNKDGEWRMRTLSTLPDGVRAFEAYLVNEKIAVPAQCSGRYVQGGVWRLKYVDPGGQDVRARDYRKLSVSLPAETHLRFEEWRTVRALTPATALRQMVDQALGIGAPAPRDRASDQDGPGDPGGRPRSLLPVPRGRAPGQDDPVEPGGLPRPPDSAPAPGAVALPGDLARELALVRRTGMWKRLLQEGEFEEAVLQPVGK